jgi:hypothetical protein
MIRLKARQREAVLSLLTRWELFPFRALCKAVIRTLQTHTLEVLDLQKLSNKVGNKLAGPQELSSKAGRAPGVLAHKDQQHNLVRDFLKVMLLRSKVSRRKTILMDKDQHQKEKEIDPTMMARTVEEMAELRMLATRAKVDLNRSQNKARIKVAMNMGDTTTGQVVTMTGQEKIFLST